MVKGYIPTIESITEAERILKLEPLRNLEHRRQMFMAAAKARLHQCKGEMDAALGYLNTARQLAQEGKYAEDKALEEYELLLTTDPWGALGITEFSINNRNNEIIFRSHDIELSDSVSPLSVSSFDQSIEDCENEEIGQRQRPTQESNYSLQPISLNNGIILSSHDSELSSSESALSISFEQSLIGDREFQRSTDESIYSLQPISFSSVSVLELSSLSGTGTTTTDSYQSSITHSVPDTELSEVIQMVRDQDQNADSFPSLEHLHVSSFLNT